MQRDARKGILGCTWRTDVDDFNFILFGSLDGQRNVFYHLVAISGISLHADNLLSTLQSGYKLTEPNAIAERT